VRKQKQRDAADHTDGLPTLLTALNAILPAHMQRVIEHQLRSRKTDAVFAPVALIFVVIPGKKRNLSYVTTKV
jgi:hypothetical protein